MGPMTPSLPLTQALRFPTNTLMKYSSYLYIKSTMKESSHHINFMEKQLLWPTLIKTRDLVWVGINTAS